MVLRSAGLESSFQRVVETGSTVVSKIASSVKASRSGFSRVLETARNTFRHATSGHGIVPNARLNAERLPISAIAKWASRAELCFPDFRGNLLFNTLGNLEVDARAGLLFIDFRSGRMLHIIGRARICWDVPETMRSAGIERLIFLDIQCVVNRDHAFPHLFDFVSYSPHQGAEGQDSKIPK